MMVRLKVSPEGQITLRREVLEHLGIGPGDEIDMDLLPSRQASLRVVATLRPIESLFGMLQNTTGRAYTIEEINEAIAAGYAGEYND